MRKYLQFFICLFIIIFIYGCSQDYKLVPPKRGKIIADTNKLDSLGITINDNGTLNFDSAITDKFDGDSIEISGKLCVINSIHYPNGETYEIIPRKFHRNFNYAKKCKWTQGKRVFYYPAGNKKVKILFRR